MKYDPINIYSQKKLQDFLDCPRRYELKYLLTQPWPAIQSEPVLEFEKHMVLGQQFHLMAQQYFSNLDENIISDQIQSGELKRWWHSFLPFAKELIEIPHKAELELIAQFNGNRLIGILDLLLIHPDQKFTIIDWKTNKQRLSKTYLQNHIQTRLYPLILQKAGKYINNKLEIEPYQIEMIYWFPEFPNSPVSFTYSMESFQKDCSFIQNIIDSIESTTAGSFQKTIQEKHCKFCNYRSLCDRGVTAGIVESDETIDWQKEIDEIDLSQIGEIAF